MMKNYLSIAELNNLYPSTPFSLLTQDKKTHLNGQITWPYNPKDNTTVVLLCPGSGMHNRDYLIGESNTNGDFVFIALAQELLEAGMAVARYDCRGVSGHRRDPLLDKPEFMVKRDLAFLENFIDPEIRNTVTPRSQYDDIYTIYNFLLTHTQPARLTNVILLGHSEGGLNISRLVKNYAINPAGIILLAPPVLTLVEGMRWQLYERYIKWIKMIPHSNDIITIDDIKNGYGNSPQAFINDISKVIPYKGFWDDNDLNIALDKGVANFDNQKNAAQSHHDDDPWPAPAPFTQTSYLWWKQWFIEDTPPELFNLKETTCPVSIFLGSTDTQFDNETQYSFLIKNRQLFPNVTATLLTNVGHTLGLHALLGPIADDSMKKIVSTAVEMAG